MASKLPDELKKVIDSALVGDGLITSAMLAPTKPLVSMPRRAGKSAMSDLMIPGYNSVVASSHPGGHNAYVDELLAKLGKPPKYGKPKPIASPKQQYIHTPLSFDQMEDHLDTPDVTEVDGQLAELVGQYADGFMANPRQFSITAPMKLITKKGKEYRNTAFIGGEEFVPREAYVGKKGQTLIMLKPVDPSDFEYLEVPEKQCRKVFGPAFDAYLRETLKDVLDQKEELTAQASRQNEIARNAQAMEQYDGFGSW